MCMLIEHSGGSRDDARLSHSSLTRSHSLNAVHEIGLQESRESVEFDSFSSRPQSAFPSIFPSSTCTAAPGNSCIVRKCLERCAFWVRVWYNLVIITSNACIFYWHCMYYPKVNNILILYFSELSFW